MSGIYGVVRYDGAPVTKEMLAPIATAMSFWGPDGHGQWCGSSAGLGHLMLRVTPESLHERLPASIRVAPHLIITADARIDNREELFDALGVPAQGRDRTPDSSLILLAYEHWGSGCLKRFQGDFAFAIWNDRERTLFCARDPFGCKPFVYRFSGKQFIFASDVKGVLARLEAPRLNEPLLAAYLQMRTYHAEKALTFFEEIVKLLPAYSLSLTAGGLQISRYWSPEDAPELHLASEGEYSEQLGFLFRQSVACCLRSSFPIGSHLSGGLDSSSVSVTASAALGDRGRELALFSWSPPSDRTNGSCLEGEYARIDAICRRENLSCEYVPATTTSLIESFQRDFTVEPVAMMAREANVQARAAARNVRVMLSGWGGDEAATAPTSVRLAEIFSSHHSSNQWSEPLLPHVAGHSESSLSKARRIGAMIRAAAALHLPDSLYGMTGVNPFLVHRAPCIQPGFAGLYRREVKTMRGAAWRQLPDMRDDICRRLETGHIPMRMEHWAASGAQHGLVYRYPMLDRRLVEFAIGIPGSRLFRPGQRRALFRRAVGEFLPPSIDWVSAKPEPATLSALKKEHFKAHLDWAHHLVSNLPESPAIRFVDPARLQAAARAGARSGRLPDLSGIREAFGCYAINPAFVK